MQSLKDKQKAERQAMGELAKAKRREMMYVKKITSIKAPLQNKKGLAYIRPYKEKYRLHDGPKHKEL